MVEKSLLEIMNRIVPNICPWGTPKGIRCSDYVIILIRLGSCIQILVKLIGSNSITS